MLKSIVLILAMAVAATAQTAKTDHQLFVDACAGNTKAVEADIRMGANVNYQDPSDGGFTPLICSARNGYLPVVKLLLHFGADINLHDNARDKTALLAASFKSREDVVDYLLGFPVIEVNAQSINGWTAIHDAGYVADLHIVQALTQHDANLLLRNENGETPRDVARRGYAECLNHLDPCPITLGLTAPGIDLNDYRAVVAYLDQETPR